jgi:hypothetical protein
MVIGKKVMSSSEGDVKFRGKPMPITSRYAYYSKLFYLFSRFCACKFPSARFRGKIISEAPQLPLTNCRLSMTKTKDCSFSLAIKRKLNDYHVGSSRSEGFSTYSSQQRSRNAGPPKLPYSL